MAPLPVSLNGWRDIILPALRAHETMNPGIEGDIRVSFPTDSLMLGVSYLNPASGQRSSANCTLLSRYDLDQNIGYISNVVNMTIKGAMYAVMNGAVMNGVEISFPDPEPPNPAQDYEDVMEGQAIMDELTGR